MTRHEFRPAENLQRAVELISESMREGTRVSRTQVGGVRITSTVTTYGFGNSNYYLLVVAKAGNHIVTKFLIYPDAPGAFSLGLPESYQDKMLLWLREPQRLAYDVSRLCELSEKLEIARVTHLKRSWIHREAYEELDRVSTVVELPVGHIRSIEDAIAVFHEGNRVGRSTTVTVRVGKVRVVLCYRSYGLTQRGYLCMGAFFKNWRICWASTWAYDASSHYRCGMAGDDLVRFLKGNDTERYAYDEVAYRLKSVEEARAKVLRAALELQQYGDPTVLSGVDI